MTKFLDCLKLHKKGGTIPIGIKVDIWIGSSVTINMNHSVGGLIFPISRRPHTLGRLSPLDVPEMSEKSVEC